MIIYSYKVLVREGGALFISVVCDSASDSPHLTSHVATALKALQKCYHRPNKPLCLSDWERLVVERSAMMYAFNLSTHEAEML
jgi:hypothetical protein